MNDTHGLFLFMFPTIREILKFLLHYFQSSACMLDPRLLHDRFEDSLEQIAINWSIA